jgi:hypothetical protein
MPLFYIEMGQGIIANGDLKVRTSQLLSCTLIAGHNTTTGEGGAYHYPEGEIGDRSVKADMDAWAAQLRPTAVILVLARKGNLRGNLAGNLGGNLGGTSDSDQLDLRNWVTLQLRVAPTTARALAAGMQLNPFEADSIDRLSGDFNANPINVDTRLAGIYTDHGSFTLFGKDRNT